MVEWAKIDIDVHQREICHACQIPFTHEIRDCSADMLCSIALGRRRSSTHPRKMLLLQPSCSMNAAPPAVSTAMRSMVVAVQFDSTTPSATASPRRATCTCAERQAHGIAR